MTTDAIYHTILEHIADAGEEGASLDDLRKLAPQASDRQLRYRLDAMRESQEIERVGQGPATRYVALQQQHMRATEAAEDLAVGQSEEVPAARAGFSSQEARDVLARLAQPTSARPLVRYNEDWITTLGESELLSEHQREHLGRIGETGFERELAGTYARKLNERLIIDLSWASSALEGNTYSLLDTKRLIETGLMAEGKEKVEAQMILNHKLGIEFMLDSLDFGIVLAVLSNLNAILLDNLIHDNTGGGRIRERGVSISGSNYIPLDIPQKLRQETERVLAYTRAKTDPFERALFLLVALPYLQPFIDGNKRTGRLMANLPLFLSNARPLSFVDVERGDYLEAMLCAYEFGALAPIRELFIFAYERSCQRYPDVLEEMPEPDSFRLEHRALIYDAVREVVASATTAPEERVDALAAATFSDLSARVRFTAMVLDDLRGLHDGNYLRYRIRPAEYAAWIEAHGEAPGS
jgi:Fic family protein